MTLSWGPGPSEVGSSDGLEDIIPQGSWPLPLSIGSQEEVEGDRCRWHPGQSCSVLDPCPHQSSGPRIEPHLPCQTHYLCEEFFIFYKFLFSLFLWGPSPCSAYQICLWSSELPGNALILSPEHRSPREIAGCCLTPVTVPGHVLTVIVILPAHSTTKSSGDHCYLSELSYSSLSQATLLHQSVLHSLKCFSNTFELHATGEQRLETLCLSAGGRARARSRKEVSATLLNNCWPGCRVLPVLLWFIAWHKLTFNTGQSQTFPWNTMWACNLKETAWTADRAFSLEPEDLESCLTPLRALKPLPSAVTMGRDSDYQLFPCLPYIT